VLAGQRPVPVPDRRGDQDAAPPPSAPAVKPKRFSPRNWRVRSRLVVLVMVPLVATVALAASRIATQVGQVRTYDHAHTLAQTANPLGTLIDAMQDERDLTVQYMIISQGHTADKNTLDQMHNAVGQAQNITNATIAELTPVVDKIKADTSYSSEMRTAVSNAESANTSLPAIRQSMDQPFSNAPKVFDQYNAILDSFVALHNFVDAGTSDESFINDARVLSTLTQLNETTSELRGFVAMILTPGNTPQTIDTIHASDNLKTLQGLIAQRTSLKQTFDSQAQNTAIWQLFNDTVTGPDKSNAEKTLLDVASLLTQNSNGETPPKAIIAYTQLDSLVDQ
jgi:hypothetical protein